jgi:UrcA family protein
VNASKHVASLALAAAAGLCLSAAASAQTSVPEVTVHAPAPVAGTEIKREIVKFADLDLKKDVGAETLIGRLRTAATRVCSPLPTQLANFKDVADYDNCRGRALAAAVQDVGSPLVQQVFKRTGG